MTFSAIGAGLHAIAAHLEPGVPAVETAVATICNLAVERPLDTNAVRAQARIRVPRDGAGRERADAAPMPFVHVAAGLVTLVLSDADAMRVAGRLRHEAHRPFAAFGPVRVALLLAAAKLHTEATAAQAAVAAARRRVA
jgi:hypothetical protein